MLRSLRFLFLILVTIASLVLGPVTPVQSQVATLPAEINKQFTPLQIDAGGTSVLRISIFNPNTFQLTDVAFVDDLVQWVGRHAHRRRHAAGSLPAPIGE